MNHDKYWSINTRFTQLAESTAWSVTIDTTGQKTFCRPARFLGEGPVDRYLLHDILKVVNTNIEMAMFNTLGLQTDLGDLVG